MGFGAEGEVYSSSACLLAFFFFFFFFFEGWGWQSLSVA